MSNIQNVSIQLAEANLGKLPLEQLQGMLTKAQEAKSARQSATSGVDLILKNAAQNGIDLLTRVIAAKQA